MKLSKKISTYLKKKLLGGYINQRGNRYESYFTLFKIIQNTNKYHHSLPAIIFSSQEYSFVDDLLIIEHSRRFFYQLKTSKKLSWGVLILKTLNFDFNMQRKIETYKKQSFELSLVISCKNLETKMNTTLPKNLKGCTKVIFFPYHESINKQISNDIDFKSELESLSAIKNPTTDKLEALASCIFGYWEASSKSNIPLSDIIQNVENHGYSFMKSRVINNLSNLSKSILDAIPDFKYLESGGYFSWSYKKTDSGVVPYKIGSNEFNQIEMDIQRYKPKNFTDLESLIS